jgi:hypothetical protein
VGHYYNPSPPHIGAQQPLTPRKLTPPQSGPAAQSPPFNGGAKLAQGILTCWAVAAATAFTYGPLTTQKVTPPVTGPSVVKTPYQRLDYQIWRAWDAPDLIAWPNFVANRLTPPSAVNPILFLNAGEIDEAILASWAAPAPVVIYPNFVADSFPPISGPTPQNPPVRGSRVPAEVQVAWIPPPFVPVVAVNLDPTPAGPTPQNPPVRGSRVPAEVQVAWIPPVLLPVLAVNLDPTPAGPTPQNPPFAGTRVPVEVQVSWLPPVLLPVLAVNLDPPIDGTVSYTPVGSRVPVEVQVSWSPQVPAPVQRSSVLTPSVPQNPPFAGTRVPVEVQVSWLPPAPGPVLQVLAIPPSSVVPPYQPVGALVPTAVLVSWIPAPTPPLNVAVNLDPPISGPVPQNPPVRGSVVPTEVQVAWLLPVLAPVLPSKGIPASGPVVRLRSRRRLCAGGSHGLLAAAAGPAAGPEGLLHALRTRSAAVPRRSGTCSHAVVVEPWLGPAAAWSTISRAVRVLPLLGRAGTG